MQEEQFWQDQQTAQATIEQSKQIKAWLVPYRELERRFHAVETLLPEAIDLQEESLVEELKAELAQIDKNLADLEIQKMLSGEMDGKNCFLSINAGAGGTEACDWALMLSRMYQRWAARKNWKLEILDVVEGDVAGIKSTTFRIQGPFAFGYCKAERGVHRLVRISPFDSNAKRHTSFASVDVTPEIDDAIEVEIRPEDLRVDTYRASGAGGQHVNKTDSAVRLTHLPTGIVVSCQSERSQVQNKETCFKLLKAKLYEKQLQERKEQVDQLGEDKKDIAFGSQVRNYVLHPYTLVKDTRTKVECGNAQSVLDGEIDLFVNAYLKELE